MNNNEFYGVQELSSSELSTVEGGSLIGMFLIGVAVGVVLGVGDALGLWEVSLKTASVN
ncbi:MAG TPA: hypothetical protein VE912_25320 [Bacteroidales bacterium]|nr:hypothetical protein [Bacteroidales bacterium]